MRPSTTCVRPEAVTYGDGYWASCPPFGHGFGVYTQSSSLIIPRVGGLSESGNVEAESGDCYFRAFRTWVIAKNQPMKRLQKSVYREQWSSAEKVFMSRWEGEHRLSAGED